MKNNLLQAFSEIQIKQRPKSSLRTLRPMHQYQKQKASDDTFSHYKTERDSTQAQTAQTATIQQSLMKRIQLHKQTSQHITLPFMFNDDSCEDNDSLERGKTRYRTDTIEEVNQYKNLQRVVLKKSTSEQNTKQRRPSRIPRYESEKIELKRTVNEKPKGITIADITPELAAQIVRHHILPMFDRKRSHNPTSSVYTELKLTDKLEIELQEVRAKFQHFDNIREEKDNKIKQQAKELQAFKLQRFSDKQKIRNLKNQLKQVVTQHAQNVIVVQQEAIQENQLIQYVTLLSNKLRSTLDHLFQTQSEFGLIKNDFMYLRNEKTQQQVQQEVINTGMAQVFKTISTFPESFKLQQTMGIDIITLQETIDSLNIKLDLVNEEYAECTTVKDKALKELRIFTNTNQTLLAATFTMKNQWHQSQEEFQRQTRDKDNEVSQLTLQLKKSESQRQNYEKHVVKLTSRVMKLQRSKFQTNIEQEKTCKGCGTDYQESDNFNWSCRTHKSDFSGELWWCCGKTSVNSAGCKFDKHQARDDGEDEENQEKNSDALNKQTCQCCKEVGHRTDRCENDPNFHTTFGSVQMMEIQQARINKINHVKRTFANTMIETTHFLKKCAIIPPKLPGQEEPAADQQPSKDIIVPDDITPEEQTKLDDALEKKRRQKLQVYEHPFKRGALAFEDYNYNLYNPYVLVESKKDETELPQIERLTDSVLQVLQGEAPDYDHEFQKQDEISAQSANLSSELSYGNLTPTEKSDHQVDEEEDEQALESQEDKEDHSIYFNRKVIIELKSKQQKDLFSDLIISRLDSARSNTKIEIYQKIEKKKESLLAINIGKKKLIDAQNSLAQEEADNFQKLQKQEELQQVFIQQKQTKKQEKTVDIEISELIQDRNEGFEDRHNTMSIKKDLEKKKKIEKQRTLNKPYEVKQPSASHLINQKIFDEKVKKMRSIESPQKQL